MKALYTLSMYCLSIVFPLIILEIQQPSTVFFLQLVTIVVSGFVLVDSRENYLISRKTWNEINNPFTPTSSLSDLHYSVTIALIMTVSTTLING